MCLPLLLRLPVHPVAWMHPDWSARRPWPEEAWTPQSETSLYSDRVHACIDLGVSEWCNTHIKRYKSINRKYTYIYIIHYKHAIHTCSCLNTPCSANAVDCRSPPPPTAPSAPPPVPLWVPVPEPSSRGMRYTDWRNELMWNNICILIYVRVTRYLYDASKGIW